MAHTIQIKRFNAPGESPGSRGTTLAYGELAFNEAENLLWIGTDSAGEQIVSTGIVVGPTQPAVDPIAPGPLWFDTTGDVLYVWTGAAWTAAADINLSGMPLGQLSDVDTAGAVTGHLLRYNGAVWAASSELPDLDSHIDTNIALVSEGQVLTYTSGYWRNVAPTGGASELDDLTDVSASNPTDGYILTWDNANSEWAPAAPQGGGGGGSTHAIDESSRTADGDWLTFTTSGAIDRMQFKTSGYAGNDPPYRGDNPNGSYQFTLASSLNQQVIFEDSSDGVSLIGYHYETGVDEGLNLVGMSGWAQKSTIRLRTNNKVGLKTTDGSIEMPLLPTSDPSTTDEVWADNGVLVLSGFTAGGGGGGSSDVAVLDDLDDVSVAGYSGNVTQVGSAPSASGQYQLTLDIIAFHNDQSPSMSLYQPGDLLTFTWADSTTTGPWTVENAAAFNDANSEFIRLVESGTGNTVGTGSLTIHSIPPRFAPSAGDVLTYDGYEWIAQAPATNGGSGGGGGYTGHTTYDPTQSLANAGEYLTAPTAFLYNNAQKTDMAAYQVGDLLTFTWANGTTAGPFTVSGADAENQPGVSSYIQFLENTADQVLGTDPLTITSVPERHSAQSGGGASEINDLSDVDTDSSAPTVGNVLKWDGTNWVPGIDNTGGGGGGAARSVVSGVTAPFASQNQILPLDLDTPFTGGCGMSGIIFKVTCDIEARVCFYNDLDTRNADMSRPGNVDPAPGIVITEMIFPPGGGTINIVPSMNYINQSSDLSPGVFEYIAGIAECLEVPVPFTTMASVTAEVLILE